MKIFNSCGNTQDEILCVDCDKYRTCEYINYNDEYMKEALAELGIDLDAPKRRSRLPRNRLGLPEIRGGVRCKDIDEWDDWFWM
jgi:hypothetical protein